MSKTRQGQMPSYRRAATDSKTSAIEFVRPLVDEIQKEITTPDVDLSSPEKAADSLKAIEATFDKLNAYRSKIGQLKPLLQQEKYELEK